MSFEHIKITIHDDDFLKTLIKQAAAETEKRTHSNHPMRHFDRTCPACVGDDIDKMLQALGWSKHEWQGLTKEEKNKAWEWAQKSSPYGVTRIEVFANAIERNLREKNSC